MTSIPLPRSGVPGATELGRRVRVLVLGRPTEAEWIHPAFLAVTALAALVYLWNLTVSGYANTYYSMAAQAGSQSWSALFFGSLDAGNFITVDKPPLSIWLMAISVRLLGLSSWSILLPQALLGVATVALLFQTVRRPFGAVAATIAAVVTALTPAAVLIFRYDNPDALLTFLLVAGAWALQRSVLDGGRRWLVLAGVLVGLAFNTKFLQAYVVLPAFALTYLVAAAGSIRRRIGGLAILGLTTLLASSWWVAIVELTPVSMRPYIGGSTTNSALELLLGYDGLGRIFGFLGIDGGPGPGQAAGGAGGGFGGTPGLLRMFNNQFGGQVGWLIPLAVVGLAVGLVLHRRAARTDPGRAAYVLWGGWLLVHGAVFSFMSGIIHSYYAVVMAPAIGALFGAGVIELWRLRERARFGGFVLAAAAVSTAVWGAALLARTPDLAPGAGIAALVAVAAAGLVLALPAVRVPRRLSLAAGAIAIAALLVGPTAYAADTMATAASGGDPAAGPVVAGSFGNGGPGGGTPSATGGGTPSATDGGLRRDGAPPAGAGNPPSGPMGPGSGASAGGGLAGGMGGGSIDQSVVDYLLANRGTSTWLVAVRGSSEAARIQLSTGMPVMAMGGFNGGDDAPTLEQLRSYVASGQLRFVLVGGMGGPDGQSASGTSSIDSWVTSSCLAVDAASGGNLYDCAAAASAGG